MTKEEIALAFAKEYVHVLSNKIMTVDDVKNIGMDPESATPYDICARMGRLHADAFCREVVEK